MTETVIFAASSHVDGASYDSEAKVLTVRFQSGDAYVYRNVPADVWRSLQHAASPGSFLHRHIRDRYAFERQ